MPIYTRQVECLNCSHTRSFVHHTETGQRMLSQADAVKLPRKAVVTCGRCGSASLLLSWGEDLPYSSCERTPRRRRSASLQRAHTPALTSGTATPEAEH